MATGIVRLSLLSSLLFLVGGIGLTSCIRIDSPTSSPEPSTFSPMEISAPARFSTSPTYDDLKPTKIPAKEGPTVSAEESMLQRDRGENSPRTAEIRIEVGAEGIPPGAICDLTAENYNGVFSGGSKISGATIQLGRTDKAGNLNTALLPGRYKILAICQAKSELWAGEAHVGVILDKPVRAMIELLPVN